MRKAAFLTALVLAIVVVPAVSASSGNHRSASGAAIADLWIQVLGWVTPLVDRLETTLAGKHGNMVDPNGGASLSRLGNTIDPDGQASQFLAGKHGNMANPDGLGLAPPVFDRHGNMPDPNG